MSKKERSLDFYYFENHCFKNHQNVNVQTSNKTKLCFKSFNFFEAVKNYSSIVSEFPKHLSKYCVLLQTGPKDAIYVVSFLSYNGLILNFFYHIIFTFHFKC